MGWREHGLVSDPGAPGRKDATHLLADAAEVTPVALVAQVRERLLASADPFWPAWVVGAPGLIRQEESAQGNDVAGVSIDGAGYKGPVLRELTDPKGLNRVVTVPKRSGRTEMARPGLRGLPSHRARRSGGR